MPEYRKSHVPGHWNGKAVAGSFPYYRSRKPQQDDKNFQYFKKQAGVLNSVNDQVSPSLTGKNIQKGVYQPYPDTLTGYDLPASTEHGHFSSKFQDKESKVPLMNRNIPAPSEIGSKSIGKSENVSRGIRSVYSSEDDSLYEKTTIDDKSNPVVSSYETQESNGAVKNSRNYRNRNPPHEERNLQYLDKEQTDGLNSVYNYLYPPPGLQNAYEIGYPKQNYPDTSTGENVSPNSKHRHFGKELQNEELGGFLMHQNSPNIGGNSSKGLDKSRNSLRGKEVQI